MSKIKGKDTKPEILLRKFLFSKGIRYRLHDKKLPGKPVKGKIQIYWCPGQVILPEKVD